jgi:hypothetical protein
MSNWYVSYWAGAGTVMSLAKNREEAISAACDLRSSARTMCATNGMTMRIETPGLGRRSNRFRRAAISRPER